MNEQQNFWAGLGASAGAPSFCLPWLCLDIETGHAPAAAIEAELALWKPPGNIKDKVKIETARVEAAEKIRERSALLDAAPIFCIGTHSPFETRVFHWSPVGSVPDQSVLSTVAPDERSMLMAFRNYLDQFCGVETILVGFNCFGFDLPKLRSGFVRHGLKLPIVLRPHAEIQIDDVMRLFTKYFTTKDSLFISLSEVLQRLGIAQTGKVLCGADVPGLIERGEYKEVLLYCALDAQLTALSWQKLTSQVGA